MSLPAVSKAAITLLAITLAAILAGAILYQEGPSPTAVCNETQGDTWHGPYHGLVDTLSRGAYKGKATIEGVPTPLDQHRPALLVNGTVVVPEPGEWRTNTSDRELCHFDVACIAANASWVRAEGYLAEWRLHGERETVLVAENIIVWNSDGTVHLFTYQGTPCKERWTPGQPGEHGESHHGPHRRGRHAGG